RQGSRGCSPACRRCPMRRSSRGEPLARHRAPAVAISRGVPFYGRSAGLARGTMTELSFKGNELDYNHHLAVRFLPRAMHDDKGIRAPALDGNLIIHGDNLRALKALLPLYAGKVDCIFIDPPYNTGNEGWSYNDNVNAPMIKEWLD